MQVFLGERVPHGNTCISIHVIGIRSLSKFWHKLIPMEKRSYHGVAQRKHRSTKPSGTGNRTQVVNSQHITFLKVGFSSI